MSSGEAQAGSAGNAGTDQEPPVSAHAVSQNPDVESSAWSVLRPALTGAASALDGSVHTWTAPVAEELVRRVSAEDLSNRSFMDKLERQLRQAPRPVVILAAELLFLHCLPLANLKPQTKIDRVNLALSWSSPPPPLTADMLAGLQADGSFNGGTGFNTLIWQQFLWLGRFVAHWAAASPGARKAALADARQFEQLAMEVPDDQPAVRRSLEYLVWPNYFEPIVSSGHRSRIRNTFGYLIGGPSGNDEASITADLYAIRSKLDADGGHVNYYREPFLSQWSSGQAGAEDPAAQRAWLVRPRQGGADLARRWITDGFVSLAAQYLPDIRPGSDLPAVRDAVDRGYQHQDYAQRLALANEYYDFLTRMASGDIVAAIGDGMLHVGVVTGEAEYVEREGSRLRRPVQWSSRSTPVGDLPSPLPSLLDGQGTVVDLTAGIDILLGYLDAASEPRSQSAAPEGQSPPATDAVPPFPSATDKLAARTHLPVDYLQRLIDLLRHRQQFVLYGPPGTGKTYLARELARHIVGSADSSRARLVQFHPSYAYEDFFEGFRPAKTASGQATFDLVPGPLRRIASDALENPGEPFVLIIDEMNRANIAKVFGELYFLLEYRDSTITLQYNPTEAFRLPRNLFVIGTMNTADRSIAAVDAAIRRRFPFVELHPDTPPIDGLLARYLAANHKPDTLARLLSALNATFEDTDRDFQIGPSYLMRSGAETREELELIWRYDILPLLQEHFYGRLSVSEVSARFGLNALLAEIGGAAPSQYPTDSDTDSTGAELADATSESARAETPSPDGDGQP